MHTMSLKMTERLKQRLQRNCQRMGVWQGELARVAIAKFLDEVDRDKEAQAQVIDPDLDWDEKGDGDA